MSDDSRQVSQHLSADSVAEPDLSELCTVLGIEFGKETSDLSVAGLLERLLEEYTARLFPLQQSSPGAELSEDNASAAGLLRALVTFARTVERQRCLLELPEMFRDFSKLCHNINNPLTALMGRAQLLGLYHGSDPQVCKAADVIQESSTRLADAVVELGRAIEQARNNTLVQLEELDPGQSVAE